MQTALAAAAARPNRALAMPAVEALLPTPDAKPVVAVSVRGRPLTLQIDTGAETSVLESNGAARLGLAAGAPWRRIAGLGGVASYPTAPLTGLRFGGRIWPTLTLPVMSQPGLHGADGLLGADLLADLVLLFDFPARTFRLLHRIPPGLVLLPFAGPSRLPVVLARLGGITLPTLLDTGAGGSAVDAYASGLSPAEIGRSPVEPGYGAGGMQIPSRLHVFPRLTLGPVRVGPLTMRITPLSQMLPMRMVLGMDVLATRRLYLDFPGRRAAIG